MYCKCKKTGRIYSYSTTGEKQWNPITQKYSTEKQMLVGGMLIGVNNFSSDYEQLNFDSLAIDRQAEKRKPGWLNSKIHISYELYFQLPYMLAILEGKSLSYDSPPQITITDPVSYILYCLFDPSATVSIEEIQTLWYYLNATYMLKEHHCNILIRKNFFGLGYKKDELIDSMLSNWR